MVIIFLFGLIWMSSIYANPIQSQNLKSTPLLYYTPAQYENLYPFVQYPNESPAFAKALQSVQSPNDLLFYPNAAVLPQQSIVVNAQPVTRFTAPPSGLVDAIYAWFEQNNVPLPDGVNKNEALPEKFESNQSNEGDKLENPDKTAGEAEVLAEADKNFSKKPKYHPGQRFYILNGQPQFYTSNYQPILPQLLTRSQIPDGQNILIFQPQNDIQQQELKNAPDTRNQNVVLVDQIQSDVKPLRYHSGELKQQNFIPQQLQVQPLVPNYSRQQLLIGRFLPQTQEIKQQQLTQTPIHQTHYVPVEVVPPQVPLYQNPEVLQQDSQQLAVIHIPVDRNIQLPQYITAKQQQLPVLQQNNQRKPILYLSSEAQPKIDKEQDLQPGVAALEFARYLASRQEDLYSDSVVVDARTENTNQNKNPTDSDAAQEDQGNQDEEQDESSVAQAQPGGIALAGPGGVAATAPRGTALVGQKGLAIASPHATAVAGPNPDKSNKETKVL